MLALKKSQTIQRQEIKNWINLQYENFLNSNSMIGGFYFTFDQLDNFLYKLIKLEQKINKLNNEMNIKDQLVSNPLLKLPTTRLEQEKKALKQEADFITTKIEAINKFNEKIKLNITYDEFLYVYKRLSYLRDEIEHFKKFTLQELKSIEDSDLNFFFTFVNDYTMDVKQKLRGEIK